MNDRFKFRAYITCNICEDVEEEQEIGFYVHDVAIYSDGMIGFSRDSLLDALSKLDISHEQKDEIEEYLAGNNYSNDYEWFSIEMGEVEQCSGLTDKNGNFVYEGDICKVTGSYFSIELESQVDVDFIDKVSSLEQFFGEALRRGIYSALGCDTLKVEVIGNIRENGDLLK